MNRDLGQLVADLARVLPTRPGMTVTEKTIEIYRRHLSDIEPPTLNAAVEELINTSEHFPTIRAIRETAAEIQLGLPRENEALSQVEARIAWRQQDELTRGEVPDLHPAVKEALDHVGGFFALRAAEKPEIVRAQFLKLYREIRAERVRRRQTRRNQPAIEAA